MEDRFNFHTATAPLPRKLYKLIIIDNIWQNGSLMGTVLIVFQTNEDKVTLNIRFKYKVLFCRQFYIVPHSTEYPIFSKRYSVLCKVYSGYCGTSEVENGLCACTVISLE